MDRLDKQGESDEALVLAAREGDKGALARLFTRHRRPVAAMCRRALRDPALAEDAVQEAAVRALLSLDRLRDPGLFGPWFAGIALNICRSWRKRSAREQGAWIALWDRQSSRDRDLERVADPALLAESAERDDWVRHAVAALPPGQRAAVSLFYLSGLTQDEAAVALGIANGAIKGRFYKARATLRQRLSDNQKEERMSIPSEQPLVEVEVMTIRRRASADPTTGVHVVVLEERGGARRLPLFVGAAECQALAQALTQSELPPAPQYALPTTLLTALGGTVREVRLTQIVDDIIAATISLATAGTMQQIEARPSDALNLALLAGAPIRVAPAVFAAVEGALSKREGEQGQEAAAMDGSAESIAILDGAWRQWQRTDP